MALHSIFGTPIIPGPALKALVLRQTLVSLGADRAAIDAASNGQPPDWGRLRALDPKQMNLMAWLFGDTNGKGELGVEDALWVPEQGKAFWMRDILTQHNRPYYRGEKGAVPDDTAAPVPVPSLSCPSRTCFAIWLGTPDPVGTEAAWGLLEHALLTLRVGGKTSSGNGKMYRSNHRGQVRALTDFLPPPV
jgi:CRISPR type III-B/RAMP module RAMP protein Cmr6